MEIFEINKKHKEDPVRSIIMKPILMGKKSLHGVGLDGSYRKVKRGIRPEKRNDLESGFYEYLVYPLEATG